MEDEIAVSASMLLTFRAANARSFRDELEFSLLATRLADRAAARRISWREGGKPIAVLPVAGIFGANGSGKTNVLRAMADMRMYVVGSFRQGSPTGGIPNQPFRLDPEFERAPSSYEVDLVLDGVRHHYGFRIDASRVLEEWAFHSPRGRPTLLFRRDRDEVELGSKERAKGRAVQALLRPNALFLSTGAAANHPLLLSLYRWFQQNLLLAQADSRPYRQALTTSLLEHEGRRDQVLALLRAADLGITGATVRELDAKMKERVQQALRILTGEDGGAENSEPTFEFADFEVRLKHRGASGEVELHPTDESLGTSVWFGLVGPVVEALSDGSVLLADELDASLHPGLVEQLIRLFQEPETNPKRAQLVFNSHDVTVLGDASNDRLVGRDQIWFTEKGEDGCTRLYSLTDLDPRRDEAIGRRYLAGRYGGTPILSAAEFDRAAELITSGDSG
jgi:hypothetical protein